MKWTLSLVGLLVLGACSAPSQRKNNPSLTLKEAVNGPLRTAENMKRDKYRHPLETLEFFEVKPNMTVVEIWPSGGWYTEILAPYLAREGKYILADTPEDPKGYTKPRQEWMARNPQLSSLAIHTKFLPPALFDVAPAGSADRVLTFRNVHNWEGEEGKQAAFDGFFKALKPGGILGVVEHRARANKMFDPKSGYVMESDVIRWAKKAGFELVAKSEINANPKDTTQHPEGVWTLPPRLRLGEKNKAKYLAIGESDRMTLKFVKPKK